MTFSEFNREEKPLRNKKRLVRARLRVARSHGGIVANTSPAKHSGCPSVSFIGDDDLLALTLAVLKYARAGRCALASVDHFGLSKPGRAVVPLARGGVLEGDVNLGRPVFSVQRTARPP
jgi:hypothetical protein